MKKKRPVIPARLRALLQQEINSTCPFCGSQEAACFEVHHLDSNPANNQADNLLMLCANCHEKIHAGQLSAAIVAQRKQALPTRQTGLELVAVVLDEQACDWRAHATQEYSYFQQSPVQQPHPVLRLTLLNRSPHTVVLRAITGRVKHLYAGLSGLPPKPQVLRPLAAYHLALPTGGAACRLALREPVELPAQRACALELTLTAEMEASQAMPLEGRYAVYLTFQFSGDQTVAAPVLCFNCLYENEPLAIYLLS